jgi:hypothetical protein
MEEEEAAVRSYWEGEGEVPGAEDAGDTRALGQRAGEAVQKFVDSGRERVSSLSPRGRIIAGTALLGVAAGIVLGTYLRKR